MITGLNADWNVHDFEAKGAGNLFLDGFGEIISLFLFLLFFF